MIKVRSGCKEKKERNEEATDQVPEIQTIGSQG